MDRVTTVMTACLNVVCFLLIIQVLPAEIGAAEVQFHGYEETPGQKTFADNATNRMLITDASWPFPSDATIVAFNVRVHGTGLGSNLIVQVWRPTWETQPGDTVSSNETSSSSAAEEFHYRLVGQSHDADSSTTGYSRLQLRVPLGVRRGDVIGLYSPTQNPVPYQLPVSGGNAGASTSLTDADCSRGGAFLVADGGVTAAESDANLTVAFRPGGSCRRYLIAAEYELEHADVQMNIIGDDVISRIERDVMVNRVVIPHPERGFPANGTLYGWKVFLQEPNQEVVFQVWRPSNGSTYTLVHQSPPYHQPIAGSLHARLRESERTEVLRDDVIAIGYRRGNPVHFDWSKTCEQPYLYVSGYSSLNESNTEDAGIDFVASVEVERCRRYSFQAEFYHVMPSTTTERPPAVNEQSTVHGNVSSTMAITTTTTFTPSTPKESLPTLESSDNGRADFGWSLLKTTRRDGVQYGTVIPDSGKLLPRDGKLVGWEVNVTRLGRRVGLQVWRPMPDHPSLFPHGRDFAFVGETKPVLPWHIGTNRFSVDQVGETPIHFRAGDVLGLRIVDHGALEFVDSTNCTGGRYYMDQSGRYHLCAQFIFQRTVVCRLYPVIAIVIWDDEQVAKPAECTDESSSLAPDTKPNGGQQTHIHGCVVLNIKSPDATYLLSNPDYPNITKHRDLCWAIHLDPSLYADYYIKVDLNDLDLHVPASCDAHASDFLEIRDGEWSRSKLLKRYCVGWSDGNDVISRTDVIKACGNYLYLRQRTSTLSYGFKGFKLHYQAVKKSKDTIKCVRPKSIPVTDDTGKTKTAAIITIVVIAVIIAAVFLAACIRKRGVKPPQWLRGCLFFRHRPFENMQAHDSPQHMGGGGLATTANGITNPNNDWNRKQPEGFSSTYVTFSPGGYPGGSTGGGGGIGSGGGRGGAQEQPVLRLGEITSHQPTNNHSDSAIMVGIPEPLEGGTSDTPFTPTLPPPTTATLAATPIEPNVGLHLSSPDGSTNKYNANNGDIFSQTNIPLNGLDPLHSVT